MNLCYKISESCYIYHGDCLKYSPPKLIIDQISYGFKDDDIAKLILQEMGYDEDDRHHGEASTIVFQRIYLSRSDWHKFLTLI